MCVFIWLLLFTSSSILFLFLPRYKRWNFCLFFFLLTTGHCYWFERSLLSYSVTFQLSPEKQNKTKQTKNKKELVHDRISGRSSTSTVFVCVIVVWLFFFCCCFSRRSCRTFMLISNRSRLVGNQSFVLVELIWNHGRSTYPLFFRSLFLLSSLSSTVCLTFDRLVCVCIYSYLYTSRQRCPVARTWLALSFFFRPILRLDFYFSLPVFNFLLSRLSCFDVCAFFNCWGVVCVKTVFNLATSCQRKRRIESTTETLWKLNFKFD